MAANGAKVVKLDAATRQQAQQQAVAVQQASVQPPGRKCRARRAAEAAARRCP